MVNSETSRIDRTPIIVLLRGFQGFFLEFEIRQLDEVNRLAATC